MYNVTVTMPDEHFEMLEDIVSIVNAEDNPTNVTVDEYASNILLGWIEAQIRGEYITYAKTETIIDLTNKIGKAKDLKAARKAKP